MKYLRIVMLLAGMAMMGWGATIFVRNTVRAAEARSWPRAPAHVTLSRVDTLHATEVGNAGDFYPHVRYDYAVGGRTFHGETIYLDEHRSYSSSNVAARELVFLEEGTQTEILYNPDNPQEAALIVDKPTWRYAFLFLLGLVLAVLCRPRRKAQLPPQLQPQPQMQGHPQMQPQAQMPPQPQPQMQLEAQAHLGTPDASLS